MTIDLGTILPMIFAAPLAAIGIAAIALWVASRG